MQREKGAPLMQNDVWRARRQWALAALLDALRWLQKTTKEKNLCQLRKRGKKERKEAKTFAVATCQTADTRGNIALISSLFKQG